MNASELKYHIEKRDVETHFFDRKTMKFFGDSMKNFGVRKVKVLSMYDAAGNYVEGGGVEVECWELYRKRAVKHGLKGSHYFAVDNYRTVHEIPAPVEVAT